MGTPNREPQEYSKNIIEIKDLGGYIPIIFLRGGLYRGYSGGGKTIAHRNLKLLAVPKLQPSAPRPHGST